MKKGILLLTLALALLAAVLPVQALEMGDLTSSSVISRETVYYTDTVKAGDGCSRRGPSA